MYLAAEEPQNPLLPVWPELVIGLICFGIVFFVFSKKLLPTINKALEERREAIEGGMEKAEAAQAEAEDLPEDQSVPELLESLTSIGTGLQSVVGDVQETFADIQELEPGTELEYSEALRTVEHLPIVWGAQR